MDPQLQKFYRQYMQQFSHLSFPPGELLKQEDIQKSLETHFFNDEKLANLPVPYQTRTLDRIIQLIEGAVKNPEDEGVSDHLYSARASLSLPTTPAEPRVNLAKSILTYHAPALYDTGATPIRIREAKHIIGSGPTTGLRTWEASLRLAHFLCQNRHLVRGKNVLELGAGTGFLSIFCLLVLGARSVVATDGNEQVLDGLRENIALNRSSFDDLSCPEPIVKKLYWGDGEDLGDLKETLLRSSIPSTDGTEGSGLIPDIILGADITYHPDANKFLAPLLTQLSHVMQPAKNETIVSESTLQPSARPANKSPQILIAVTERAPKTLGDFFALLNTAQTESECTSQPDSQTQHTVQLTQYTSFKCPVEQQKGLFHSLAMPIRIFGISLCS